MSPPYNNIAWWFKWGCFAGLLIVHQRREQLFARWPRILRLYKKPGMYDVFNIYLCHILRSFSLNDYSTTAAAAAVVAARVCAQPNLHNQNQKKSTKHKAKKIWTEEYLSLSSSLSIIIIMPHKIVVASTGSPVSPSSGDIEAWIKPPSSQSSGTLVMWTLL